MSAGDPKRLLGLCFDELHYGGFDLVFKIGDIVWTTPLTTVAVRVFVD